MLRVDMSRVLAIGGLLISLLLVAGVTLGPG